MYLDESRPNPLRDGRSLFALLKVLKVKRVVIPYSSFNYDSEYNGKFDIAFCR